MLVGEEELDLAQGIARPGLLPDRVVVDVGDGPVDGSGVDDLAAGQHLHVLAIEIVGVGDQRWPDLGSRDGKWIPTAIIEVDRLR